MTTPAPDLRPTPDPHSAPDIRLVVLDMAGTTVADGGLVERAFDSAARALGVEPGSPDHADKLAHVRATMGESKISVFRHLFGDEDRARRANTAFEEAYGALVADGLVAPSPAPAKPSRHFTSTAGPSS